MGNLSFTKVGSSYEATLTATAPVKIHIEAPRGGLSFYSKLEGGTRYDEIKGASRTNTDTTCITITDEVFPFDIMIRSENLPSLAKYEFAE